MKLEDVYKAVEQDSKENRDLVTPALNFLPSLKSGQVGLMTGKGAGDFLPFTEWGERSYLSKVGIPAGFYKKCTPDLQLRMASEFHGTLSGSVTLRLKQEKIRFVGSDQYTAIDNIQIMRSVMEMAPALLSQMEVREVDLKERSFVLRAVCREPIKVPIIDRSFRTGIQIVNSETGCSALRMQFILFEEICTNGMVSSLFAKSVSRIHKSTVRNAVLTADVSTLLGNMDAFHHTVKDVLTSRSEESGLTVMDKILGSVDVPETIKLRTTELIPKYEKDITSHKFIEEGPYMLNVLSAFTEAIQHSSVQRLDRVRMESFAGKLLGV